MKLSVIHPEAESISAVQSAINEGDFIYRSPHVGNVNNSELGLICGLTEMGAMVQVELVDSIRGDDRYSRPQVALVGDRAITLASRNAAKSRVVGSCQANDDGVEELAVLGVDVGDRTPATLKSLHVSSLRQALPETASVTVSSEYFASIGLTAYMLVLKEAQKIIDRPLRLVDPQGKLREVTESPDFTQIYGMGENPEEGLLPPLESMMAIEVIKKLMDNGYQDGQIVHVAGPDMIRYTKEPEIMQPVEAIAGRVISELVGCSGNLEYVVPCMKTIVQSEGFGGAVGGEVQSQYDMLLNDEVLEKC